MADGPREKLLYVACICCNTSSAKEADYVATVDLDPDSPTYSQVGLMDTFIIGEMLNGFTGL